MPSLSLLMDVQDGGNACPADLLFCFGFLLHLVALLECSVYYIAFVLLQALSAESLP